MLFQQMDIIKEGSTDLIRLKNSSKHAKWISNIAEIISMQNQELKQKINNNEIYIWQFNKNHQYLGAILVTSGKYQPPLIPATKINPGELNNKLSKLTKFATKSLHHYEQIKDEIGLQEYKTASAMLKLWIKAAQKIQSSTHNSSYIMPDENKLAIYDSNLQTIGFEFLTVKQE